LEKCPDSTPESSDEAKTSVGMKTHIDVDDESRLVHGVVGTAAKKTEMSE
jgi:hypothetical protein